MKIDHTVKRRYAAARYARLGAGPVKHRRVGLVGYSWAERATSHLVHPLPAGSLHAALSGLLAEPRQRPHGFLHPVAPVQAAASRNQ